MAMNIFEYFLRWGWDIIFLIRLNKLLVKVPGLRKYACKEALIRGGVTFAPTHFIACASSGRLPEVKLFICAGIWVNIPGTDGNTALSMAAHHGHKDVVSHLLSLSETDINARNDNGDTALLVAAREGKIEVVSSLLAHKRARQSLINLNGDTTPSKSARKEQNKIKVKLLKQPALDIHARNKAGDSALLEAARRGYEEIAQQLQNEGAEESELEKKVVRWQLEQKCIFSDAEFLLSVQRGDQRENVNLVERFLIAGMDPNTRGAHKDTPLIIAAREGNIEIVCCLLANKAIKVNLENETGDTALIVAARGNHGEVVAALLEKLNSKEVNIRNKAGDGALLEAARRGYEEIVQQLQMKEADEPELEKKVIRWQLEQKGIFNDFDFLDSVQKGKVSQVKKFLVAGMEPNTCDDSKNTSLIIATREENVEIVGQLLAHKSTRVNQANNVGDTALIVAARGNQKDIIIKLLEHTGIEVNARNRAGESALLEAARRGYEESIQLLQNKGAVESELERKVARWQLEKEGVFTEIHFIRSIAGGNMELAQKYLRAGINVNSQNDKGETALIVAVRHNQLEMVTILLAQPSININLPDPNGFNAAEMAISRNYLELAAMLREAGADVNLERASQQRLREIGLQFRPDVFIAQASRGDEKLVGLFIDAGMHPNAEDDHGDTALIDASRNGQRPIVDLLIVRGADVNLRNRLGVSPLEAAVRSGYSEIADLLRRRGAEETNPSKENLLDAIDKDLFKGVESALEKGTSPDMYTEKGEPILVTAVRQRRNEIVDLLIKRGASVDARDREQKTALMRASELGLIDMMRSLLNAGANLEEMDGDGNTPLISAVRNGQFKAAQTLKQAGANINAQDKSGCTVQRIANLKGHPEIIKLLNGADHRGDNQEADLLAAAARGDSAEVETLITAGVDPTLSDEAGNTALALAASRGWTKVIESLKPSQSLIEKKNNDGDTPLMQAARGGSLGTVELLLQYQVDINAVNNRGETALLQAAMVGKGAVVKKLAERGANPNLAASATTPLIEACFYGQLEAVQALLEGDADVNQQLEYGFSPLMTAMLAGHEDIEKELRARKAALGDMEGRLFLNTMDGNEEGLAQLNLNDIDLNARDRNGWSALMIASREGFAGVVKMLLDKGVNTNIRSRDGKTNALMEAAIKGHTEVLRCLIPKTESDATGALLEAAANGHAEAVRLLVNESDACKNGRSKGRVPLIEAASRGHIQVVQVLLELGADTGKKSRDGITAIMAAQLNAQEKVVELLVESGLEEGIKEANLLLAAGKGNDAEVERLLSHPFPPSINARDEEGLTALMRACKGGHRAVVDVLFSHMGEKEKKTVAEDKDYQLRTTLMWAARGGNVQIVGCLLSLDVDIHAESGDRRTALMEACNAGRFEVVKRLLESLDEDSGRVTVNHQDENGNTPLSEALMQKEPSRQWEYVEIVQLLVRHGAELGRDSAEFLSAVQRCDIRKVNELIDRVDFKKLRLHGKTPLMLCAEKGCLDVAGILIDRGVDVNDTDPQGTTALMLATTGKYRRMVQLLLNSGADCDRLDSKASNALIKAVQKEATDIVGDFAFAGANPNYRDGTGNTALIWAVLKDNPRLVELLLNGKHKANLDILDRNHRTALAIAHLRGSYTWIREKDLPSFEKPMQGIFEWKPTANELLLLGAGARKGWNVAEFILSVRNNDLEQLQYLIADGVDVNIRDFDGSSALLIACRNDNPKIAQALIKKGAGVEVRNHDGRTPLMESAKQKKNGEELIRQLFQAKPDLDLNAQDKWGETAILEAARAGNPDIVMFFVDREANINPNDRLLNINAANHRGETPLIEMAKHPWTEPVEALLRRGANVCARDANYRTAIVEAAQNNHLPVLELLLVHLEERLKKDSRKRGIVINAVDHESKTAVDLAEDGNFIECVNLLRQHGGKRAIETDFVVFTTRTGECYHRFNCGAMAIARKNGTFDKRLLRDAIREHFELCDRCTPSLEEIDWSC